MEWIFNDVQGYRLAFAYIKHDVTTTCMLPTTLSLLNSHQQQLYT